MGIHSKRKTCQGRHRGVRLFRVSRSLRLLPSARRITTVEQIRESSFDIKATGRLNRLYVELLKDNPDWAKAERRRT
jgi:hypothetical protein